MAVEHATEPKAVFVVMGRGTSSEGWQHVNGQYLFDTFEAADAVAKAKTGSPDNWYETTVLGPGAALYRAS